MGAPLIGMLDSFASGQSSVKPGANGGGTPTAPQAATPPPATSTPIIPDAGVYGAETAAAVNAYNNAVAQATANRNSLYNQYGLSNDGSVDPNNPQGAYQQMLRQQADLYNADQQDAVGRGLRGGLAHQAESHDVNNSHAQDFQFQQQVANTAQQYAQQNADALNTEQGSISQAYQDAINTALQNQLAALAAGQYDAPGVGTPAQASTPVQASTPAPKTKPKSKKGGGGGGGHANAS